MKQDLKEKDKHHLSIQRNFQILIYEVLFLDCKTEVDFQLYQ